MHARHVALSWHMATIAKPVLACSRDFISRRKTGFLAAMTTRMRGPALHSALHVNPFPSGASRRRSRLRTSSTGRTVPEEVDLRRVLRARKDWRTWDRLLAWPPPGRGRGEFRRGWSPEFRQA